MPRLPFGYDETVISWTPHLCTRTSNALINAAVRSPRDLVLRVNDGSFRAIRNLGRRGQTEIERWLLKHDLLERTTNADTLWEVDGVCGWLGLSPRISPSGALIFGWGNNSVVEIFAPGTWTRVRRVEEANA